MTRTIHAEVRILLGIAAWCLVIIGGRYVYSASISSTLNFDDATTMGSAPRVVHTADTAAGCPPTRAAGTDLFTQSITLARNGTIFTSGQMIRSASGRVDLLLFVDGVQKDQTLTYTPSAQWEAGLVQWSGALAAGAHTISLRSPTANAWGCNNGLSEDNIDTIVFE